MQRELPGWKHAGQDLPLWKAFTEGPSCTSLQWRREVKENRDDECWISSSVKSSYDNILVRAHQRLAALSVLGIGRDSPGWAEQDLTSQGSSHHPQAREPGRAGRNQEQPPTPIWHLPGHGDSPRLGRDISPQVGPWPGRAARSWRPALLQHHQSPD